MTAEFLKALLVKLLDAYQKKLSFINGGKAVDRLHTNAVSRIATHLGLKSHTV